MNDTQQPAESQRIDRVTDRPATIYTPPEDVVNARDVPALSGAREADEITYVDAAPTIPGHLGTNAPHVHHRDTDACLRAPDGVACPTPAELRAEVERLWTGAPGSVVRGHVEWLTRRAESAEAEVKALRANPYEVWDSSVAPGGMVCRTCGLPVESEPCWEHNPAARWQAASESAEAERDALQQQVAKVQALADSLRWVRPDSPCVNSEACCGGPEACDAMQPSVKVVGRGAILAALGGPAAPTRWDEETDALFVDAARRAAPTSEPTIVGYDGFGAPIMDHVQEPQIDDEPKRWPTDRHPGSDFRCMGWVGSRWHHPPYGLHIHCDVEGCKAVCQPCSVGDGLHRSSPHTPAEHEACECADPVERITDDRGDELERGADTDAEAANQPHTPAEHNGRTVCSCGDFNCASLDANQPQDGGA